MPAPNDHFAAGPHCRVIGSGIGRVGDGGRCPPDPMSGLYLPPVFKLGLPDPPQTIISLPVQTAVWKLPGVGRVGCAGGCPTVRLRVIFSACVALKNRGPISAPDDHFTAGPHCRVSVSVIGRVGQCSWLSNCRCWDYISLRYLAEELEFQAELMARLGHNISRPCSGKKRCYPRQSSHCRSTLPCDDLATLAHWWCLLESMCRPCTYREGAVYCWKRIR